MRGTILRVDIRVERTRKRLQEALFELAHERDFDLIAVSDIAERAGVNRSTFYQHYSDKETVLADALDGIAAEAGATLDAPLLLTAGPPAALVKFLEHIEEHAVIYRRIFVGTGSGAALARLRQHIYAATEEFARQTHHDDDLIAPIDVVAAGVAGSMVGVIGAWLSRDNMPPAADAAQWIWAVVLGPPTSVTE
jgi:AcrR family transcriptional regulator